VLDSSGKILSEGGANPRRASGQPDRVLIMHDELAAQVLPGAVLDRGSGGYAHGATLVIVTNEVDDSRAEICHVSGLVEPSSAGRVNEVDRPALAGADDRHATGLGLLDSLAEGLELSGGAEDVHTGDRAGEFLSAQTAGEDGIGKLLLQLGSSRAIPYDDELGVGDVCEVRHVGDALLGGKPSHVSDHDLTIGSPLVMKFLGVLRRVEANLVDAATPDADPRHPMADELIAGESGRGVGCDCQGVDLTDAVPAVELQLAETVAAGVRGDVSLVDRHHGDAEGCGCQCALVPDHEGSGQVNDIRLELGEVAFHGPLGAGGDADVLVARPVQGGQRDDGKSGVLAGSLGITGSEHEGLVAVVAQVLQHS